jgi:hypothetical protein
MGFFFLFALIINGCFALLQTANLFHPDLSGAKLPID